MKIIIPGNLLLIGEYAITLPHRKGIALAIDSYLTIETAPSSTFSLTCTFEGKTLSWKKDPLPLIELISKMIGYFPALSIHIDASSFSYADGVKKGFGSSAATTVGLCYCLLKHRTNKEPDLLKDVFPLALHIHRVYQGGRGSGYDVLASLMGGAGIFTGGKLPTWQKIDPSPFQNLSLVRGDQAVSTKNALERFEKFSKDHSKYDQFLRISDKLVDHFSKNPKETLNRAALINCWLNQELGLPITWSKEVKALGAGGEIGVTFNKGEPLKLSPDGLRCL